MGHSRRNQSGCKPLFEIGLHTGCRLRETRIPMSCVDFTENKIVPCPKGGEDRAFSVPMPTAPKAAAFEPRRAEAKIYLGLSVPALLPMAPVLHQGQDAAPMLPLLASHLRQSAPSSWRSPRGSDATGQSRIRSVHQITKERRFRTLRSGATPSASCHSFLHEDTSMAAAALTSQPAGRSS